MRSRFFVVVVALLSLALYAVAFAQDAAPNDGTIPVPTVSGDIHLPLISKFIPTATPTSTPLPTATNTPLPTATKTPLPPTATKTAVPPTNTSTPVPSTKVEVIRSNTFEPYSGANSLYLVGEVVNNTGQNVQFVKINAVLRDAGGNILDGNYTYSDIDTLAPGMTSGFMVIFSSSPNFATYELTVSSSKATSAPVELQVTNLETYFDSSDAFHVRGNVTNQFSVKHTFVKVFIVLYGPDDQVIGVEDDYLDPNELEPGQQAPFDTDLYFWAGKPDHNYVKRYTIHAYDD